MRVLSADRGEDRAAVIADRTHFLAVVADGAGGTGGGAEAADAVVSLVREHAPASDPRRSWRQLLLDLDCDLAGSSHGGQTTAVVLEIVDGTIFGASVGDSCAWLLSDTETLELTTEHIRKPLLGSGACIPVSFGPVRGAKRVILGSDGLFKYVPLQAIHSHARCRDLTAGVEALVLAARLPSGGFQDDIAVILCELA